MPTGRCASQAGEQDGIWVVCLLDDDELAVMASEREIEQLVHCYARICDENYDPDRLAELFTDDAVWMTSSKSGTVEYGVHEGRAAIRSFFADVSSRIVHSHHIVMSPEIEVVSSRSEARGRWNTIVLIRLAQDELSVRPDEVQMVSAAYEHSYRREQGVWRIAHLKVHILFDVRLRCVG